MPVEPTEKSGVELSQFVGISNSDELNQDLDAFEAKLGSRKLNVNAGGVTSVAIYRPLSVAPPPSAFRCPLSTVVARIGQQCYLQSCHEVAMGV